MLRKLSLGCMIVGVLVATAATNRYRVEIFEDSVVEGKALKAGEYRIEMQNDVAVITQGKQTIEVPAHSESVTDKFPATEFLYDNHKIQEIHLGGSRIKIVFGSTDTTAGGAQ
jgi:hypothetical protein